MAGEVDQLCGAAPWASPSPQNLKLVALHWRAWEKLGCVEKLKKAWLSQVAMPGTIVFKPGRQRAGFVLRATEFCVLLWGLDIKGPRQNALIIPSLSSTQGDPTWFQVSVTELEGWKAAEARVMPPSELACRQQALGMPISPGVCLTLARPPESLHKVAARLGFKGMTTTVMDKLYMFLVGGQRHRRLVGEAALCRALILLAFPEWSVDEVDAAVKKRRADLLPSSSEVLEAWDIKNGRSMADDDMVDEIMSAKQKIAEKRASKAAERRPKSSAPPAQGASSQAPAGPASSSSSRAPDEQPAPSSSSGLSRTSASLIGSATPEYAKQLAPDVKGCAILCDTVRHNRWQVRYPSSAPPFSNAKSWNSDVSYDEALRTVLRWA